MRVVAIIQARMGSTRLPGKVLKDLGGQTVLARVVDRTRRCKLVSNTVVATSNNRPDELILKECERLAVEVFCGSEHDVLDRYYRAALKFEADILVRITSDCPLLDPSVSDLTIQSFLDAKPDYASNVLERTYPRGLDTEVLSFPALEVAWRDAKESSQREHVTPYLYTHPEKFKLLSVKGSNDYSRHRWTLDTAEDLDFLRAIYARLGSSIDSSWRAVLGILDQNPELTEINRHIEQKTL